MQQVTFIGDARARPEDLRRQLAGKFEVAFTRLDGLESAAPGHRTLFDIDLEDATLIVKVKDWLRSKPQGARVLFATDKLSRLQHTRAYALGATEVIQRPIDPRRLADALGFDGISSDGDLATLAEGTPEFAAKAAAGVKAAVGGLQDIFSSAFV